MTITHSVTAVISFTYSQKLATDPCSERNMPIIHPSILISSSHLRLDLPNNLHSRFWTEVFFVLLSRTCYMPGPTHYSTRLVKFLEWLLGSSCCVVSTASAHTWWFTLLCITVAQAPCCVWSVVPQRVAAHGEYPYCCWNCAVGRIQNMAMTSLTFWRRIFFFQIVAHPVFKMWVIQKPNKVALWNKRHFEGEKMEIIQHV